MCAMYLTTATFPDWQALCKMVSPCTSVSLKTESHLKHTPSINATVFKSPARHASWSDVHPLLSLMSGLAP